MTIQQCKYVLEINKTGSMNEASKKLFIAQSSLSQSIKQLEEELGIKIFARSKNGVILTPEGAEFLRYAEQMVEQNEFILNRYSQPKNRERLSVATQHYDFIADVFCNMIKNLSDKKYDFSLREIKTFDIIKEVENASCDIGIIAIKDGDYELMSRYLTSKGIQFVEFLTTSAHVYVRKNHPLSEKMVLNNEDLGSFPFVCYEQGSHNTSFFTEEIDVGFEVDKKVEISDRATLMNVLLTTDCYTVGTGVMPSALNDRKIVSIPYKCNSYYRIGYILNKSKILSTTANLFLLTLKEYSKNLS